MGVRVVEGEQPGYAIFLFDKPIDAPTLQLAVRSLQVGQGAFIGMGGSWVKLQNISRRRAYRRTPASSVIALDPKW